ncbi:bZIP transcription factor [Fibrisoma montanum]|uniref:BZIP transcription factor n=1 Tax=Fibrisoma montanum TaxID=2305895 RepID=A0A418M6T9_9BACT|nr:bZIP transcription factor [Fibrisoma montanum]
MVKLGLPVNLLGQLLISGDDNTYTGFSAGENLTSGNNNTFYGSRAGQNVSSGDENTFIGALTGLNSTGRANTLLGYAAGNSMTTANFNTFIGDQAGRATTTGGSNFMMGTNAGQNNVTGQANFFLGDNTGGGNTGGSFNVYLGQNAGNGTNVNGDNNTAIGFETGRANAAGINNTFVGFRADAGAAGLQNATAIGNNARVNISNAVVLGNGANVGIGNSAPSARLHVTTGVANQSGLRLENLTSASPASASNQTKFLTVDASGNVILGSPASSGREAATEAFWQKNDAGLLQAPNADAVVIGKNLKSTPAGYRLFVADGILTEKVKVAVKNSSDWSDYVFADDYKLRSLESVEAFVKANKHLPGVPSAEQVVSEGVDMAKMDAKLLEKIEELTLYMIQLKKDSDRRINQLEKENQELKQLIKERR